MIELTTRVYDEKLKLSKDIFGWAEELAKQNENGEQDESAGHAKQIYCGKWGHECSVCSYGCWSKVYLTPDAALRYCPGFRLIRLTEKTYRNPEDFARSLAYEYILKLHSSVRSKTDGESLSAEEDTA